MTAGDFTAEVLDWVRTNRPLVCGTTAERELRPHADDIEAAFRAGLIIPRANRWDLTGDGELTWASLRGCMAGAR